MRGVPGCLFVIAFSGCAPAAPAPESSTVIELPAASAAEPTARPGAEEPNVEPESSAAPFRPLALADYLIHMHNRIHPQFADTYLTALEQLPGTDPRNDPALVTTLEMTVLADGKLGPLHVTRASGVEAFDLAVVECVMSSAPFVPPAPELLSREGRFLVSWSFHRDRYLSCSTRSAAPVTAR